jgi:hypothetical protein
MKNKTEAQLTREDVLPKRYNTQNLKKSRSFGDLLALKLKQERLNIAKGSLEEFTKHRKFKDCQKRWEQGRFFPNQSMDFLTVPEPVHILETIRE